MAKIVESTGDDAKAKARHAKIAREKKDAEIKAKEKVSDEKWKAIRAEEKRKEEIKKLPKEERAAARKELKEQIRHRKDVEKQVEEIAEQVQEAVEPTEHQEGVPGEIPAENVEAPEKPEQKKD